ncbi:MULTISPECIES: hypothetical protein [Calothrix]|uniref:Uncharacterized protein n=2 Tax=Calothrix TaxID=1186 RepID=A0ABR8AIA8_9CYAN|nr:MULTISPECIES: hypothetical protein [Calothrix]MBD2199464.1 hypothetical protein [Calothrix parietina FACHB-288]MBD2228248.1 hypothetical protein [Calothrix anomala FACHB-343]
MTILIGSGKNAKQNFVNGTGALYFDEDGSATAFTQVQFAQFSDPVLGVASLGVADFVVV